MDRGRRGVHTGRAWRGLIVFLTRGAKERPDVQTGYSCLLSDTAETNGEVLRARWNAGRVAGISFHMGSRAYGTVTDITIVKYWANAALLKEGLLEGRCKTHYADAT